MQSLVDRLYRTDSRPVLATLIRLLGDFDRAEEALADAFAAAVERWPADGVPDNPRSWLISTGRFKAIDALRRRARFDAVAERLAEEAAVSFRDPALEDAEEVEDDQLRLVFMCCHPSLAPEGQVALTLREVCGLTTEEIARAFLTTAPTVAQRIVRAKGRIREERIPYQLPGRADLTERLDAVLSVIYLVFNEGYSASAGSLLTRPDLSTEAIRLGRLVAAFLPEAEVFGLLALMLLSESRRTARTAGDGELVLLADQRRSLWDARLIEEGRELVERALRTLRGGRYTLQAAIAAVHSEARAADETDWPQIVGLYDVLSRAAPSPIVELNRAVAVAMRDGPEAGLELVDALLGRGELSTYQPAHATRADLLRRAGRGEDARAAYRRALDLTAQAPERRFLERRLRELAAASPET